MAEVKVDALFREKFDAIIDVRSPAEFAEDHIPGAVNCPVLSDAERAEIGTIYKQISPFEARKKGAALIARNIALHVETAFITHHKNWRPLIYCWRGGQRSASLQTVLREIGWRAVRLEGGYKAYRNDVLERLKVLPEKFRYIVVNGSTGSGKTRILQALAEQGAQVLDLEEMANHKGSVLGLNPDQPRQSQKAFDTALADHLSRFDPRRPVFVEAEGRRIGIIHLPPSLFDTMTVGTTIFIQPSLEARVEFLLDDYAWLKEKPEMLREYLSRLKIVRGKETIERWNGLIDAGQWPALIEDLLVTHYDPLYRKSAGNAVGAAFTALKLDQETFKNLAQDIRARFDKIQK